MAASTVLTKSPAGCLPNNWDQLQCSLCMASERATLRPSRACCRCFAADVGFGGTATGTSLFGQQQQQQSSGASLFGNTAFGAAKPMFGAATTTATAPFKVSTRLCSLRLCLNVTPERKL